MAKMDICIVERDKKTIIIHFVVNKEKGNKEIKVTSAECSSSQFSTRLSKT